MKLRSVFQDPVAQGAHHALGLAALVREDKRDFQSAGSLSKVDVVR